MFLTVHLNCAARSTGRCLTHYWLDVGEIGAIHPKAAVSDNAIKLDADLNPADGLSFNFQYFNIGAGYFSVTAARRESDVLLTEGSESAWYNWGNALWSGGATADYTQGSIPTDVPVCRMNANG